MFRRLLQTPHDYTITLIRLLLGIIFFAHGAQKALGWFGGGGWSATMGLFTHRMGVPPFFAALAICAEFLGGIGLILGLLSRIAAFGIAVDMLVAVFLVHLRNGLFMNWYGNQRGEGIEYHLLAIGIAIMLLVRGAGALSLDRILEGMAAGGRRKTPIQTTEPHPIRG